jgi:hypothetical protein
MGTRELDGDACMSKEDEYRRHAADILGLARRATSALVSSSQPRR